MRTPRVRQIGRKWIYFKKNEFIMNTDTPLPTEQQIAHQHTCKNCQTELQGEYCHHCGQQDKQYMRSIFAVVGDLFGEIGHWDSRFYRTLRGLFLQPGFLSLEFVRGRHASYVPPLRLYFFISLIAFMVFTSFIEFEVRAPTETELERAQQTQQQVQESLPDEVKPLLEGTSDSLTPPTVSLDGGLSYPDPEAVLSTKLATDGA